MLILLLSFALYVYFYFYGDGVSNDTAVIYIALLALYLVLSDIKALLKEK